MRYGEKSLSSHGMYAGVMSEESNISKKGACGGVAVRVLTGSDRQEDL